MCVKKNMMNEGKTWKNTAGQLIEVTFGAVPATELTDIWSVNQTCGDIQISNKNKSVNIDK